MKAYKEKIKVKFIEIKPNYSVPFKYVTQHNLRTINYRV